eukprot:3673993-Prymnesium_polylepis.1
MRGNLADLLAMANEVMAEVEPEYQQQLEEGEQTPTPMDGAAAGPSSSGAGPSGSGAGPSGSGAEPGSSAAGPSSNADRAGWGDWRQSGGGDDDAASEAGSRAS